MKMNNKANILLIAAGMLVASVSQAATIPGAGITEFNSTLTDDVFTSKYTSWRDPAFGDMGWTHSSDWGTVNATKGQMVTITMKAEDVGIHPGITVWYRGADDTAPDNYVVDHFYPQNANYAKFGATDDTDTTGAKLGNIIMYHVAHAYDMDGNSKKVPSMKPITDSVPGQLKLSFKATKTGVYMFVVGGFNPDKAAALDSTIKYNIDVNVTVTP
jgi:hypothetical protein